MASNTVCAINAGALYCWGSGIDGLQARGNSRNYYGPTATPLIPSGVQDICGANASFCVLTTDNAVKCWGSNTYGQLGDGTLFDSYYPVNVSGLTSGVSKLSCDNSTACVVTEGGGVKCWGYNLYGNTGTGTHGTSYQTVVTPTDVPSLSSNVVDISVGHQHACAVTGSGEIYCWGSSRSFYNSSDANEVQDTPLRIVTSGATRVGTGYLYTCWVSSSNELRCRGQNSSGQLGLGYTSSWSFADTVVATGVAQVRGGWWTTCATLVAGGAKCWGSNNDGALAIGSSSPGSSYSPITMTGITSIIDHLDLGSYYGCLSSGGSVSCWGRNDSGQLGDGSTVRRYGPTPLLSGSFTLSGNISINGQPIADVTVLGSDLGTVTTDAQGNFSFGSLPAGTTYDISPLKPGYVFRSLPTASGVLLQNTSLSFTPVASGTRPLEVTGKMYSGDSHVCILTPSGGVVCFGDDDDGRLGHGQYGGGGHSRPIGMSKDVTSLALGSRHSCALKANGAVYCWGSNTSGQLGSSSSTKSMEPYPVTGLSSGVIAIAAGGDNTCAILSDHSIKCWGAGESGQIGNGETSQKSIPTAVVGLSGPAEQIAVGKSYVCALLTGGSVQCWGKNNYGQVTLPSSTYVPTPTLRSDLAITATKLAAGTNHSCAISNTGTLHCWGRNLYGSLGDMRQNNMGPVQAQNLGGSVREVAMAEGTTCAILNSGALKCWGSDAGNLLGDGNTYVRYFPYQMPGLTSGVHSVAMGAYQVCVSMDSGRNYCWGTFNKSYLGTNNNGAWGTLSTEVATAGFYRISGNVTHNGQPLAGVRILNGRGVETITDQSGYYEFTQELLYNDSWITPQKDGYHFNGGTREFYVTSDQTYNISTYLGDLSPIANVSRISVASVHGCLVTTAGAVKCWGTDQNSRGLLGQGLTTLNGTSFHDVVGLSSGGADVEVSDSFSCVLTSSGAVKCWGNNTSGILTSSSTDNISVPTTIDTLSSGVIDLSVGYNNACVVLQDGAVKCWGGNEYGKSLPNTEEPTIELPTTVPGLPSAKQVSTGSYCSCMLSTGGAVWCWGINDYGCLGNGSTSPSTVPVQVSGLSSGVTEIGLGAGGACAIKGDGSIVCWGQTTMGIGDPVYSNTSPVAVPFLSNAQTLSLYDNRVCATLGDGSVWCWGPMGGGDGSDRATVLPYQVGELGGEASRIDLGNYNACIALTNGQVKCFGVANKVLGDWTTGPSYIPLSLEQSYQDIGGSVTASDIGVSGVAIETNGLGSTTTNSNGLWSMVQPLSAFLTVSPQKDGYFFTPPYRNNSQDYLANATFTATAYSGSPLADASAVFAGGNNACLISNSGTTRCWGQGGNYLIGNGSSTQSNIPSFVSGLGQDSMTIGIGSRHACAVMKNGSIKCWGRNDYGQLGDNSTTTRKSPSSVVNIPSGATAIAVGGNHTCAIVTGKVYCWGRNSDGQLGQGNMEGPKVTPLEIPELGSNNRSICTGQAHSCAVTGTGSVYCWGLSDHLELGASDSSDSPLLVSALSGAAAQQVACGSDHSCALLSNGDVMCWGRSDKRQVGRGVGTGNHGVGPVYGLHDVSSITAQKDTTCALKTNGEVWCWGDRIAMDIPSQVKGLPGTVTTMALGNDHSCFAMSNGQVRCFGNNTYGQLGEGLAAAETVYSVRVLKSTDTISGQILLSGSGLSGVTVNGGALGTKSTDSQGRFSFAEVPLGSTFSLSYSKSGYVITPTSSSGTVNGPVSLSVVAKVSPHKITGKITLSGKGLESVSVNGYSLGTTSTSSLGNYAFNTIEHGATYTLRPSKTGYSFIPSVIKGTANGDVVANFTASKVDTDKDGLSDLDEAIKGTDPKKADTDGDGLSDSVEIAKGTNPLKQDTDGDGLSDSVEITKGTNPLKKDTDGDGIPDGQDSNPTDSGGGSGSGGGGSTTPGGEICSEWNGFLGGMMNIMEHVNLGSTTLSLSTSLYDISGVSKSLLPYGVGAGRQYDLIANTMTGYKLNSYGKLCSKVTKGSVEYLDGRMVYYRIGTNGTYEFAFAMPFGAGLQGRQYLQWNTVQPSKNPADAANLVTNWVQITSLETSSRKGMVIFYDNAGAKLAEQRVTLAPGARQDVVGHRGLAAAGMVEWIPDDLLTKAQIRNVRYFYDNALGAESFDGAFQFESASGTSDTLVSPVDTRGADSTLQVSNTLGVATTVELKLYNSSGKLLRTEKPSLAAHSTWDFKVNSWLKGALGIVSLKAASSGKIIAYVLQSGLNSDASLLTHYGIAPMKAQGSVLRGSYNTFLGQTCSLLLTNATSSATKASISMVRHDKTQLLNGLSVTVPGNGILDYNLCDHEDVAAYGVVTVQPTSPNSIYANVVRIGANNDYRFPTPVRE